MNVARYPVSCSYQHSVQMVRVVTGLASRAGVPEKCGPRRFGIAQLVRNARKSVPKSMQRENRSASARPRIRNQAFGSPL